MLRHVVYLRCRLLTWRPRGPSRPLLCLPTCQDPMGAKNLLSQLARVLSMDSAQVTLASVAPVFSVMRIASNGHVSCYERNKAELCQELGLQPRYLRFQHLFSIISHNNCVLMRMGAILSPDHLLFLDFRAGPGIEAWLREELVPQLLGKGQLATYSLPFEFWALEGILQHKIGELQRMLADLEPSVLHTLEGVLNPQLLSLDRSQLHALLQTSRSLSELETDVRVFRESLLNILDDDELISDLCLTRSDGKPAVTHADEMELLLDSYLRQADEAANSIRGLKELIDDSESVVFLNLDSHRNIMMRLSLQLTMGTFSLTLFGLVGVAFGMNLQSNLEEDPRAFWLITGLLFMGSGIMWRHLLSFLGHHLEPSAKPPLPSMLRRNVSSKDAFGKRESKPESSGFNSRRHTFMNR
uniref:magnesium transporter MRS2 homolog, mitochondrial isoform X2 n=1 Tax=Myxine glutinosa TaxID=7769 RepID=UPI00358F587F